MCFRTSGLFLFTLLMATWQVSRAIEKFTGLKDISGCVLFQFLYSSASANAVGYANLNDNNMYFSNLPSTMRLERFEDSLYYFGVIFKGNYFQAMNFCKYHGMELVSIESSEENTFLYNRIHSFLGGTGEYLFWSSGIKTEPENHWVWMGTGKPMVYFSWLTGQPGNTATERYMEVRFNSAYAALMFNDQVVGQSNHVICEVTVPKSVSF